jgi:hypothetical protein
MLTSNSFKNMPSLSEMLEYERLLKSLTAAKESLLKKWSDSTEADVKEFLLGRTC